MNTIVSSTFSSLFATLFTLKSHLTFLYCPPHLHFPLSNHTFPFFIVPLIFTFHSQITPFLSLLSPSSSLSTLKSHLSFLYCPPHLHFPLSNHTFPFFIVPLIFTFHSQITPFLSLLSPSSSLSTLKSHLSFLYCPPHQLLDLNLGEKSPLLMTIFFLTPCFTISSFTFLYRISKCF